MLDSDGLWPECDQAPAVWPWHQSQGVWTLAIVPRQTRRLQSGRNLRSSERALYEIIDCDVLRMTTGMTDHEHHIGRRFLRRRIDGERKLAHQDVALSYTWAWDCIQKVSRMRWSKGKKPGSGPTGDCAGDIASNFNVSSGQSRDFCALQSAERCMVHVRDSSTCSAHWWLLRL